ncbi:MAG: WhiB family transcriptional regulator [Nakamurella sp.]
MNPLSEEWDWQRSAACRGMDSSYFFCPPHERGPARDHRVVDAKLICRECPVIADCLAHALRVRESYGIWGGHTEVERERLLGITDLRRPGQLRTAGDHRTVPPDRTP